MKKNILLFLSISVISCQNHSVSDKKANEEITHNARNPIDYVGTYKGILPCADCDGMDTEIAINENSTFSIKTKYEGKGDKVFMQKGNFVTNKQGNVIILTNVRNGSNKYLVGENTLTQLDIYGKKSTGSFADDYVLSKQSENTLDIENTIQENTTTVDLDSRIAASATIKKVNPAVGKYTLAETTWKLVLLNDEKLVQKGNNVYYLKLKSKDGRFVALSGCNSIIGYYVMPSSTTLTFSRITSTKTDCVDDTLESHFFTTLAETKHYKLDKETLTLFDEDKKRLAKLVAFK